MEKGRTDMATRHRPTIVGVYNSQNNAEQAIQQLYDAGIPREHISYSGNASAGGVMESIKHLFSSQPSSPGAVRDDLMNMGLTSDEANYYVHEYDAGHSIVAVSDDEHIAVAKNILGKTGAYDFTSRSGSAQRPGAYSESPDYAPPGTQTRPADQVEDYTTPERRNQPDYTRAKLDDGTPVDERRRRDTDVNARQAYNAQAGNAQPIDRTASNTRGAADDTIADKDRSLRLREEQLQVEKQRVQTGEVSIHKEVVEERRNIDVPVTHEEVVIDTHPVRDADTSNTPIGEGETIRMPVSEERVNVNKKTVTTGEVSIGKRSVEETKRVSDTVRREEAHIDRQGQPAMRGSDVDMGNRAREDRIDAEQDRDENAPDDVIDNNRRL
jgi:uncharacterized protein (TIGR02271 family)